MAFDFPNSPIEGQVYKPANGPTYVYSSGVWKNSSGGSSFLMTSDTPPTNPYPGQFWWDSDTGILYFWYVDADSSQWVQVGTPQVGAVGTADERNRIVNPCMQVSQEQGSAAVVGSGVYPVDHWQLSWSATTGVVSAQQVLASGAAASGSNAPAYLRALCTTIDAAVAAGDLVSLVTTLEGLDVADLYWGSASARAAVLRFTAYSNNGGTFCAYIRNYPTTHSFVAAFTLPTGVWTDVVIPIPAPAVGTWVADNTLGAFLGIGLMVGSTFQAPSLNAWNAGNFLGHASQTNFMATLNNDFRITNVGLYKDPNNMGVPPPFAIPDYAEALRKCQRYWQKAAGNMLISSYSTSGTSDSSWLNTFLPVVMRTAPAVTFAGVSNANATGPTNYQTSAAHFGAYCIAAANGGYTSNFTPSFNARM